MSQELGVLGLALANVQKTDGEKAQEAVRRAVRKNQNDWRNSIFAAREALDSAKEFYESLKSNVNASAEQMLDASRNVSYLAKNLTDMEEISEVRFNDAE
jgi:phage-related tail protein